MRRLCSAYTRNATDRDDLFQDVFLAVWRSLPSFRGDSTPRTWLYRIAHNTALTWRTRGRRRDQREEALAPWHTSLATGDTDLRRVALQQAIASLSPADRLLTLLWLEGLTAAEIQEVTGVQPGTVAVRLSRIRQRLTPTKERP